MEYARLGTSSLEVSRLCLGMMSYGAPRWQPWVLDETAGIRFVSEAVDHGINFFDVADAYSFGQSEVILGKALKSRALSRDRAVIATKVGLPVVGSLDDSGLRPERIMRAIDLSLARLGTDYVDLYQVHGWDPEVPVEDTLGALNDLVRVGKVRAVGASNYFAWQLAVANNHARLAGQATFVSIQAQYNLVYREEEREMLPFCRHERLGVVAYSPLARGYLAGIRGANPEKSEALRAQSDAKGQRLYGRRPADERMRDVLAELAGDRNRPPSQIALAWVLSRPPVTAAIIGVTEPRHLAEATGAFSIELTGEEVRRLEEAYEPRPPELGNLSGSVK